MLTRMVLSTDDPEIAKVGQELGLEVPCLRPPELASDESPMLGVVQHMLRYLEQGEGFQPEAVALLQPTSPLRRAEHIDGTIALLLETGAESVVSVVPVPHHFNPVSLMRLVGERLVPYVEGPLILRRQEKPKLYARNGPAVLVTRTRALLNGSLYGSDCRPYLMAEEDSIDIDSPLDLELAEFFLRKHQRLTDE
jgi:CMP-N-acetylneuraminic acid synthetase